MAQRALIKIRNFITVMGFPGIIQTQGIASCNINFVCPIVQFIDVFTSLLSFTLTVELIFCLFYSCYIDHYMSQYLCMIRLKFWPCVVFIDYLSACDDRPVKYLSCADHIHAYKRWFKDGRDLMQKNISPLLNKNNQFKKTPSSLEQSYFIQCGTLCKVLGWIG